MRKVIAVLNEYGYEVMSYKKKYYYYYVVSHLIETVKVVMLADTVHVLKIQTTKKTCIFLRLS